MRLRLACAFIALAAGVQAHDGCWPSWLNFEPTPGFTYQQPGGKQVAQPLQKITTTVGGITFDSNYDNGSLVSVTSPSANTFNLGLLAEPSSEGLNTPQYWFRFRMTGVAGRTIRLNVSHPESPRPWIRIEGGPWRQTTSAEAPNTSRLDFTFTAQQNVAEVAFFEPLGMQETYDAVYDLAASSPHATVEKIGESTQGRDFLMVTVTDERFPSANKKRIWIHSRAHAGEVTSTHNMIGFLQQAVAEDEAGRRLRQNCIINIVPLLNVDGVFLGHTRWDSQGLDPERRWCSNDFRTVESQIMKSYVDQFMASPNPIRGALNLHSTVGNWTDTFFFKHIRPSVTAEMEAVQQAYIDAFNAETPLFDNLSAQTSQLSACIFFESYMYNNWGSAVYRNTHEGHYRRRITDNAYITGDDYKELGRAQARAFITYFNLPAVQPDPIDPNPEMWVLW